MRIFLFLNALALLLSANVLNAQEAPPTVVVALDTSRSLSSTELRRVTEALQQTLSALPSESTAALLAFDDTPRWVRPVGASLQDVGEGLRELKPQGNFTLLHDALFTATRELPQGGVVLLATDGRDENSATTVEDIARRSEAQEIRILSLGIGNAIDERRLRRLALLSNGAYLGRLNTLDATTIARAVTETQDAVAKARLETSPAPPSSTTSRPPAESTAATESRPEEPQQTPPLPPPAAPTDDRLGNLTLLLALAGLVLLALITWWWQRRKARAHYCRRCGSEKEPGSDECLFCDADELQQRFAGREIASLEDSPEVTVDTAVFHTSSLDESLEKTRVLSDQGVLVVRRAGQPPRLYLLGYDKAFAVGRSRQGNTLTIPDPALSSQHFKIVPENGSYYFVDLGSTNNSFINGQKIPAKKLRSGDVIRAGQVEFEYQNPLEK